MKFRKLCGFLLAGFAGLASPAFASDEVPAANAAASANESVKAEEASGPSEEEILAARPAEFGRFCLFAGTPPLAYRYTELRKLKVGRQTYGSVKNVLPELVEKARALGAEAIVGYNGSQRFGFWPWRLVRPVASGTAIKWNGSAPNDCKAQGGSTVEEILMTNKAPSR